MAIGPDGQEDMHVGMASFPQPASSRARPSAPTMDQAIRQMGLREWSSDPAEPTLNLSPSMIPACDLRPRRCRSRGQIR